ncbi:hypothetical protein C8Q79DRAFT_643410 [Trametes meyenii]|nr:hypothetical protein C8Q79DRAFT_643410 [Trametes meyenii]
MSTTSSPPSSSRYIPHSNIPPTDLKAVRHRIHDALLENVQRVHRHPSSNPKVYVGSADSQDIGTGSKLINTEGL